MSSAYRLISFLALSLVGVVGLTSCVHSPSTEPVADSTVDDDLSAAQDSAEATEPAQTVQLPACESISLNDFPIADDLRIKEEDSSPLTSYRTFGPSAVTAAEAALQHRWCTIYLPDSGFMVHLGVFELTPQTKSVFIDALETSDYEQASSETEADTYLYFEQYYEEDHPVAWLEVHHMFQDSLWFTQVQHQMGGEGSWPEAPGGALQSLVAHSKELNTH